MIRKSTLAALIVIILSVLAFLFVNSVTIVNSPLKSPKKKFFGYVGIDCGTNYIHEVANYTNLNQLCVYDTGNIQPRLKAFKKNSVKAFLDLHFLFFEEGGTPGGSGIGYKLRPDYRTRWREFVAVNQAVLTSEYVGAFYVAEEPTWLGLTRKEVQTVAKLVKSKFPKIPLALIEAHQALVDLVVPTEIDWIGMDYYGAIDPRNTNTYSQFAWINLLWQDYYAQLKARRSRPDQKLILVFDAQFSPAYESVGYTQASLADFVRNYHLKMASDPDIVAMIGYVYFSGLDADSFGLRDLPKVVKRANVRVGKLITGK